MRIYVEHYLTHLASQLFGSVPFRPAVESRPHRATQRAHRSQAAARAGSDLPLLRASQRAEDRVLDVLVRKTETIKKELGSLSKVIDDDIERHLAQGIRHRDAEQLAREIEQADIAMSGSGGSRTRNQQTSRPTKATPSAMVTHTMLIYTAGPDRCGQFAVAIPYCCRTLKSSRCRIPLCTYCIPTSLASAITC